jgi:hypothetical protein
VSESKELLGAYLNDHLAGATAGVELAEQIKEDGGGTPLGSYCAELELEIEADRQVLADLIERLGIQKSGVKQVGAAAVEKLSRLRFHPRVTGSPELTLFMQVEVLTTGIEGKRLLWEALKQVTGDYPEVAATDLDTLIERARQQREGLAPFHLSLAAQSMGAGPA